MSTADYIVLHLGRREALGEIDPTASSPNEQ
jgi:hypothetical protein